MNDRKHKDQKGSLLIAGLWAMSLFSVMTASLGFSASQEALMLKRNLEDTQARWDFVSGLNLAAALIESDTYPHEDSTEDAWYGTPTLKPPYRENMKLTIEDEESKLNLNTASAGLMNVFFRRFEENITPLQGSRKDYVKQIAKLRSERRIESLEALLLMEDFEPEDLEPLRSYVTVYPEFPWVNLNTAKPLIIETLLHYLSGDTGLKQIFLSRWQEASQKGWVFFNQELEPEAFREKLELPKSPLLTALIQEFLSYVTTDSETFHTEIEVNERTAEAVFRFRVGEMRPHVLWWHEK